MAATPESTPTRDTALATLNDAANAHHAIKATADALSDAIYARHDPVAFGMYEALMFSIAALDRSIGSAMEQVGMLPDAASAH